MQPFHLAIPVDDLENARAFYRGLLGCKEGRSSDIWVDFDLYGHQLVVHNVGSPSMPRGYGKVDNVAVPVPHFGVLLSVAQFTELAGRLRQAGCDFVIAPTLRYAGKPAEQHTMFLLDPSGNALEFKAFTDPSQIFAT
jgi:extradiol dioxygenase family protein